jgi:photosystem II stability/assembly factor-like uncharacterized protein
MNTNPHPELLDSSLEAMLRQRAGNEAPSGLIVSIATAVDATPQSPKRLRTWLAPRRRGGAGLVLVAAIVGISALGVAIVGGARLTSPDQRRTTNDPVASPAPSGPGRSPKPSALIAPGVAHDFGTERWLVPYLFPDGVGWITATHRVPGLARQSPGSALMATQTSLFRTTAGGQTWTDRTPRHAGAMIANLVIDADTAVVGWGDGHAVSISITHDAGVTWTTSILKGETNGPLPLFASATNGTLMFFDTANRSPARVHVYRTPDGGQTWDGPTAGTLPAGQSKFESGAGVIWLNVGKVDNIPFNERLWVSVDGGVTWPVRHFPDPPFASSGTLKWAIGPPVFEADGAIVLAVSAGGPIGVFRSADDGQTWQMLQSWQDTTMGGLAFTPLSPRVWVLADPVGTEVISTTDGGDHWRTVMGDRRIFSLVTTFATPDHGWAAHECDRDPNPMINRGPDPFCDGNALTSVLLETTDGGKSWHPLGT